MYKDQKTKLYSIASFLSGISLATLIYLAPQMHSSKRANLEETVLAEMLYDNFQRYSDNCNIQSVTNVMTKIQSGHYTKLEKQKYDAALLELVTKKATKKALANLQKSEKYLSLLEKTEKIIPIVDKKVYIEILEEGSGDPISLDSPLSLHIKQYDETGKTIKDNGESETSTITLSKMVKGFQIGIEGARKGEKRKIYIHPEFGYAKVKIGSSANHLLIYEVTIL